MSIQRAKPPLWLCFFPFYFSLCSSSLQGSSKSSVAGWPAKASQTHAAYANPTIHPVQSGLSLSVSLCFSISLRHPAAAGGSNQPLIKVNCAKACAAHCQGFSGWVCDGKISACMCVCELVPEVSTLEGGPGVLRSSAVHPGGGGCRALVHRLLLGLNVNHKSLTT